MKLLQKYVFVPLDIFKNVKQNEDGSVKIEDRLDAWLAFFCMDAPEVILAIIEKYPDFKALYEQVYTLCQNVEEVMQMFSKELREMDRNTEKLMSDEMQKELDEQKARLTEQDAKLTEQDAKLTEKDAMIKKLRSEKDMMLTEKDAMIKELQDKLSEMQQAENCHNRNKNIFDGQK